jgi:hypothetical protein
MIFSNRRPIGRGATIHARAVPLTKGTASFADAAWRLGVIGRRFARYGEQMWSGAEGPALRSSWV